MSEIRSMWLNFFRNAGIPAGFDTKYAVIFDENRIRPDMLMDITKECLRDMGVTAMGDIIAILKHAKKVYEASKEEALEQVKPSSTVSKIIPTEAASKSVASSTTPSRSNTTPPTVKTPFIQKTVQNKTVAPPGVVKSSILAKASSTKPVVTSQKITSSTKAPPKNIVRTSVTSADSPNDRVDLMKKKIIILRTDSDSDSSTLKEEVPVQKKIRVLPEHEGKYKIKYPDGTTPKTQKLLQARCTLGPIETPKDNKKLTVFERLGESNVSSTCDTKSHPSSNRRPTEEPDKGSSRTSSSVFARLGSKSGNSSSSSPESRITKSVTSTKFEVRQTPNKISHSERSLSTAGIRDDRRDKPSIADRPKSMVSLRDPKTVDLRRSPPSNTYNSGMRSDTISRQKESTSVKERLGANSSQAISRSRSRSPIRKRVVNNTVSRRSRSRSPIYFRDDGRNVNKRPSSVVTAPPRGTNVSTKVPSNTTDRRDMRRFNDGDVLKEERVRSATTGKMIIKRTIVKRPESHNSSRSVSQSQDPLQLPDIEDPLARYYSDYSN